MNFYVKVTLAVAVLVAVALGLIFLLADKEEDVIRKLLQRALEAAQKGDAETVVRMVSKDYRSGAEEYDAVVARIRRVLKEPRPETLEMTSPSVQVDGDEARASVTVKAKAGPHELGEKGFRATLRREEDGWKIVQAEEVK